MSVGFGEQEVSAEATSTIPRGAISPFCIKEKLYYSEILFYERERERENVNSIL